MAPACARRAQSPACRAPRAQGKVTLLTTMKDEQRLELLKEVAGTRTYDEKKKESLRPVT